MRIIGKFSVMGMSAWLLAGGAALSAPTQPEKQNADARHPTLDLPAVAAVRECATMRSVDVSREAGAATVVKSAEVVDEGKPGASCSLQVEIENGYAKLQLNLPLTAWTQRLLFGGGPGAQVSVAGLKTGPFVTAVWQDLGHRSHEDFFADNYQYRVNSAYRSMHLQVLAAKALIAVFYGQPQRFSYFDACSWPGREGLMLVQRYPKDFDGVGAGCPPINFTINNGIYQAWNVLTNTGPDGGPILTADRLPILHRMALDQCDAIDGVRDGIISDVFSCHLNVRAALCRAGDDPSTCLSAAQVHVAEELYRGAHDDHGNKLTPGGVLPGSELAWTATIVPGERNPREPRDQTTTALRSQFAAPALPKSWELGKLKFDRAAFETFTKLHFLWDATNPNLSEFAQAGHKLILWQALGDTNVLPAQTIQYFEALQKVMGAEKVHQFVRFYTLPGVHHCGGGDGPVITDLLPALMAWVERGVSPGALSGAHAPRRDGPEQAADLTRPIYPYPYVARYSGTGRVTDAENFSEGPARAAPPSLFQWLGSDFYASHPLKWCAGTATELHCTETR
jgi:feruloyl esterase